MNTNKLLKDILFGALIGDALGVPYEFRSRERMRMFPATSMIGQGSHNQPPGTYSDDGSLTLCLADSLMSKIYDLQDISDKFIQWYDNGLWAAHYEVFDIGIGTQEAILNLKKGISPHLSGKSDEYSNGNGSLMRILPLLAYILPIKSKEEKFKIINEVSSITHAHIRSIMACYYYMEYACLLTENIDKYKIYQRLKEEIPHFFRKLDISDEEINKFSRLLYGNIYELSEEEIIGDGYVLHSLEACIWCLLNTNNYKDAVLQAVNLGDDTDTTAAITGGLVGILYGYENIPKEWTYKLARRNDIEELCNSVKNS